MPLIKQPFLQQNMVVAHRSLFPTPIRSFIAEQPKQSLVLLSIIAINLRYRKLTFALTKTAEVPT